MFEFLIHGEIIFIGSALFSVCLIVFLIMGECVLIWNGWDCDQVLWVLLWCSFCQCVVHGVLHYQENVTVFPTYQNFLQGGGVFLDHLDHLVKRLVVRIYNYCGEGIDEKLDCDPVDHNLLFGVQHCYILV